MMGRVMWNEFFNNTDWPMASAVTCVMVLLLLVPLALFQYNQVKQQEQPAGAQMNGPNKTLRALALGLGISSCMCPSSA